LLAILALAHAGDERFAALSHKATLHCVATRLNRLHRQVARDGRHFETLPVEQQHRVRKRLKRLRYVADLTASLWPRKQVRSYLKRLGAAQDALGAHNDVAVAAEAFRNVAPSQPEAWFGAGYLQAHLAVTGRAARQALVKVADGGRFWA
jgi:CHAD domain-containing protein